MTLSKIRSQRLYAELSEAEYRELRLLAIRADSTIAKYLGWVLRKHLAENGRPTEGSVKA